MKKILIVEDSEATSFLIAEIIRHTFETDADICYAASLEEALPQIPTADLVVTDYDFPEMGFPALLPTLQKEQRQFILQSASIECLRMYDPLLQIGTVEKGINFTSKMICLLQNIRFNNIST
jgi:CheY-like chemotaxis protein